MAIGLDVDTPPEPENPEEYDYEKCPFYGELPVRGQILEGTVVSTDMDKTVVVEREYDVAVPKYDRYMKRRSRIPAHVPGVLEPLSVGDTVKIAETRPLSKTKSHVVVEVTEEATAADVAELTGDAEPDPQLSAEDLAGEDEGDQ
ncbi:30S ribosomal protein S17 [Natrarchaeobaculum aegyptiacum]|uniref:Small ribosomal subunit protein uS17 n=1 Tax=Natrarchaeobaculum aegyptiacum TaxID=745377 RepID=A0A2Z2HYE2_9EURY|nr:30S ribosomal protein S17 [Natrarchaeobaculum aegyptiacum]ARS88538.1 30S ribosomal protein S17 [Natrarchaeobaculum aegyptiacum]